MLSEKRFVTIIMFCLLNEKCVVVFLIVSDNADLLAMLRSHRPIGLENATGLNARTVMRTYRCVWF